MDLAAMETAVAVFPLAAIRVSRPAAELTRNLHLGLACSTMVLHPAPVIANSNTASGLRGYLCDFGRRSLSTGKERDAESGLDYFGARYFSGAQGRWASPDQPFADQHAVNPQSWNLYSYSLNNPLRYVDDDGLAVNEAAVARARGGGQRERPYAGSGLQMRLGRTCAAVPHCMFAFSLLLSIAIQSRAGVPQCPSEQVVPSARERHGEDLRLPREISLIYRPLNSPRLVIEARFGADGQLLCSSPLSGLSLYWRVAVAALEEGARPHPVAADSVSEILVFDDPGQSAVRRAWESGRSVQSCGGLSDLDTILQLGNSHILWKRPQLAGECFAIAVREAPNSLAAHYGAAVAAGLVGDLQSRIEHYEKVVSLAPEFYEARLDLAVAMLAAGKSELAEMTLRAVLLDLPPLPTQQRVYEARVNVYDRGKRRRDAVAAMRSLVSTEAEIKRRDSGLVDEVLFIFDTKELAAREEEVGEYRAAAQDFGDAARGSAATPKVSEAVQYEADLGRIRALKRLGQGDSTQQGCAAWRQRLRIVGLDLKNRHWGGRSVAQAQWEFSCGDFGKGLRLLQTAMARNPSSDVPYLTLEQAYRARGDSASGDKAHAFAERIRTTHDAALLGAILKEADDLSNQGGARRIP